VAYSAVVSSTNAMFAEVNLGYAGLPPEATEEIDAATPLAAVPRPNMVVGIAEECLRRRIRAIAERAQLFTIAAEIATIADTITTLRNLEPDLLLLDTDLPDGNSLELLSSLPTGDTPQVILVATTDHHAVRAFELCALDYLVKPIGENRLRASLTRARQRARSNEGRIPRRGIGLREACDHALTNLDRVVVKTKGKLQFIDYDEIYWIEAAANYVRIHTETESYLVRTTIGAVERGIDSQRFLRIHRSIIVNFRHVRELEPCNSNEYIVTLTNGKSLSLSRSHRSQVDQLLRRLPLFA
jgi:two-component system, LytTR family, response regulator